MCVGITEHCEVPAKTPSVLVTVHLLVLLLVSGTLQAAKRNTFLISEITSVQKDGLMVTGSASCGTAPLMLSNRGRLWVSLVDVLGSPTTSADPVLTSHMSGSVHNSRLRIS